MSMTTEETSLYHAIGGRPALVAAVDEFYVRMRFLHLPAPADQLSGLPAGGGSLISEHHVLFGRRHRGCRARTG